MKVALVHDWLTGMRGGENVLAEIVRRMTALRLLAAPRHTRSIFMEGYKEMRLGFERSA